MEEFFLTVFRRSGVPEAALDRVGEWVVEEHRKAHLWTRVEPGTVPGHLRCRTRRASPGEAAGG